MGKMPTALKILKKCHSAMSSNYDNSLNIPSDILAVSGSLFNIVAEWEDYLKYKFRYLLSLETKPYNVSDTKFIKELRDKGKGYLKLFLPEWKERAKNERVVCFYRYCQLPEKAVENMWYYQKIQDCYEWCQKRKEEMALLSDKAKKTEWHYLLDEIYNKIKNKPFANYDQEQMLSAVSREIVGGLVQRVDSIRRYLESVHNTIGGATRQPKVGSVEIIDRAKKCFTCFKNNNFKNGSIDSSIVGNDFLENLSLRLTETLHSRGFNETEVIGTFLRSLKDYFLCEVCDFLDVNEDNTKVVWRVATVEHKDLSPHYKKKSPEELRKAIRERESYGKGVGISGSILLADNDASRNVWYHLGSNDVEHDPRQSKTHRHAYEADMYPSVLKANKKINNFWMFPVFIGDKLVGAFRVVNKLNEKGQLQPGGWPYIMRVQISLIAQWFSRFLETTRPQMQSREDYVAIMNRNVKVEEMMKKLNLGWTTKGVLLAFLRHLSRDISKKKEKRSVGCCIFIVRVEDNEWPLKELDSYPILDINPKVISEPYDALDEYHDAVNPLLGAYVFDQGGDFVRIAKLECKDEDKKLLSGYEAIEWITKRHKKNALCLLLPCDTKNILVYQNGKRAVEVHLSEVTGAWRFRYAEDILNEMIKVAPTINRKILKTICDACVELSYRGLGAIIAVGDIPGDAFILNPTLQHCISECRLDKVGIGILVEFAKIDGATFVTKDGIVTKVATKIYPKMEPAGEPLFPGRGARHDAGQNIAKCAPKALVVIVSENRGISLIAKGGSYIKRDL